MAEPVQAQAIGGGEGVQVNLEPNPTAEVKPDANAEVANGVEAPKAEGNNVKVRGEEIELLRARVKNLKTELQAALSKPGPKNQEMIDNIKQQHEELISKAKGMIFYKTKMVQNQELQIEELKDLYLIKKDLLEISNSEVKAVKDRVQAMEARFKAEKERYSLVLQRVEALFKAEKEHYSLVLQRAETSSSLNGDLKTEYQTQLKLFKAEPVQAQAIGGGEGVQVNLEPNPTAEVKPDANAEVANGVEAPKAEGNNVKVRGEEIELLRARVKNLETELQAALSKPGPKNQEMIDNIKQQHEELISEAKGMSFAMTEMIQNQKLLIEDLKDLTEFLLEISNSEVEAVKALLNAEKERYSLVQTQLKLFKELCVKYEELEKEYERLKD